MASYKNFGGFKMKKKLNVLLVIVMLTSMLVACGGGAAPAPAPMPAPMPVEATPDPTSEPNNDQTPEQTPTEQTVQENGEFNVTEGAFVIGDAFGAAQYIVTSDSDSNMSIIVFESESDFNNYDNADRRTFGEEREAVEQNALFNIHLGESESAFLSFKSGNVMVVTSGSGVLDEISLETYTKSFENTGSWDPSVTSAICTGVFFVGTDLDEGQYSLTVTNTNFMAMSVAIFESRSDYMIYLRTSRFTHGEESEAIEANAFEIIQLFEGNSSSIQLSNGNVLMLSGGIGTLEMQNSDISGDILSNNTMFLYSGLYFIGDDIDESHYVFTSIETGFGMNVVVFENINSYLGYFRTSRFTGGEERAAIEQNALKEFYIHEGHSCFLSLRSGMILLLMNGNGILETADMSWTR